MRPLAIALALVAACGRASRENTLEVELRRAIGAALGVTVDRVRCTTGDRCVAVVGATELPVRVEDAGANELAWSLDGLVLRGAELEAAVEAALQELGVTRAAACGPRVRIVKPGDQITCDLAGSPGKAWARIDASGAADLEIALESSVVSARTEGLADAELEALSRALDPGDHPGAVEEPGEGGPNSATPTPRAPRGREDR